MDLPRTSPSLDSSVTSRPSAPCADPERARQDLQRTFDQQVRERTEELHQTIHDLRQEIERHRATEAALSERERRYQILYEQNPSMYFTLDPHGLILSVNQFGATALGYRPDELIGQPVLRVFQPDDHHTVLTQLRICSGSPETTFDWEIQKIRKDGSRLWVKERARLITDHQGRRMILVVCEDITDRRTAEETVRESERRLRRTTQFLDTLVREAPLPIVSLDAQGTVNSWNQAATALFGWTADEVLGRELPYIPPDREAEANALWEQGTRNTVRGPIALRRQRKDGSLLDVLLWPVFIYDDAERLSTAVGLYVDQSDLQRAEEGLRESEGRLRAFAAAIPDLALVLDEQGRYVEILSHTEHLLYADATLLKGRLLHEVLPQADADLFLATIRRTIETGQSQRLEYPLNVKAGLRWFEGRTSLMQPIPGKIKQIVWVAHDITERKRAEEALRVSEERFAKAFRSSPHPIIVTELDTGRCLEVNDAGLTLFGYKRDEVIGQTILTLGLWPTPESRTKFFARLAAEGALRNIELQFYAKDRTTRQCLISCEPIEINGKACLVTVGADITEQKQAEEALRSQERILQQARDERERISQDLHDNILQSLYAVGMQLEASKMVASKSARKAKTHITHAIGQLNHLVLAVRHFLALLHKRNTLDMDFGLALRQLATSFSSGGDTAPMLDIDQAAIALITPDAGEQLLSIAREALSNSVRHAEATRRSITLRLTGPSIQLCVSDDGVGFPPTQKRRRGHGLANMARRAKHIGATFVLTSTPGQGTCVTVEVPVERSHEPGTI